MVGVSGGRAGNIPRAGVPPREYGVQRCAEIQYLGYVFLDPQERSTLIKQSSIKIAILFDILGGQKSIQPDSVLKLDEHHLVPSRADKR